MKKKKNNKKRKKMKKKKKGGGEEEEEKEEEEDTTRMRSCRLKLDFFLSSALNGTCIQRQMPTAKMQLAMCLGYDT